MSTFGFVFSGVPSGNVKSKTHSKSKSKKPVKVANVEDNYASGIDLDGYQPLFLADEVPDPVPVGLAPAIARYTPPQTKHPYAQGSSIGNHQQRNGNHAYVSCDHANPSQNVSRKFGATTAFCGASSSSSTSVGNGTAATYPSTSGISATIGSKRRDLSMRRDASNGGQRSSGDSQQCGTMKAAEKKVSFLSSIDMKPHVDRTYSTYGGDFYKPQYENSLIVINRNNLNIEYLQSKCILDSCAVHDQRRRLQELAKITSPDSVKYLIWEANQLTHILAVWQRRCNESDFSRLCIKVVWQFAKILHSHGFSQPLIQLLGIYRQSRVLNYMIWALEIHFYRREHQVVVLCALNFFASLEGADEWKDYMFDLFAMEYADLNQFCGHVLPSQVTQSCYIIGHLFRGSVSVMQILILILKELVIRRNDTHQANNGAYGNDSEGDSLALLKIQICETMFQLLYHLMQSHESNRMIFLAHKGVETLAIAANSGFLLVKSNLDLYSGPDLPQHVEGVTNSGVGVASSDLSGRASVTQSTAALIGDMMGKNMKQTTDKAVIARAIPMLHWYFRILLDFGEWTKNSRKSWLIQSPAASDNDNTPLKMWSESSDDEKENARTRETNVSNRKGKACGTTASSSFITKRVVVNQTSSIANDYDYSSPVSRKGKKKSGGTASAKDSDSKEVKKSCNRRAAVNRRSNSGRRSDTLQRWQDRLRQIKVMDFLAGFLESYQFTLVHHQPEFLHLLLELISQILDRNERNCLHFVDAFNGLDSIINIFSLFNAHCESEGNIQYAKDLKIARDALKGEQFLRDCAVLSQKFKDQRVMTDEEVLPKPSLSEMLELSVRKNSKMIPFLQCNFLNLALVCEKMPVQTQNMLLEKMVHVLPADSPIPQRKQIADKPPLLALANNPVGLVPGQKPGFQLDVVKALDKGIKSLNDELKAITSGPIENGKAFVDTDVIPEVRSAFMNILAASSPTDSTYSGLASTNITSSSPSFEEPQRGETLWDNHQREQQRLAMEKARNSKNASASDSNISSVASSKEPKRVERTRLNFLLDFIEDFFFCIPLQSMCCHFLVKFLLGHPFGKPKLPKKKSKRRQKSGQKSGQKRVYSSSRKHQDEMSSAVRMSSAGRDHQSRGGLSAASGVSSTPKAKRMEIEDDCTEDNMPYYEMSSPESSSSPTMSATESATGSATESQGGGYSSGMESMDQCPNLINVYEEESQGHFAIGNVQYNGHMYTQGLGGYNVSGDHTRHGDHNRPSGSSSSGTGGASIVKKRRSETSSMTQVVSFSSSTVFNNKSSALGQPQSSGGSTNINRKVSRIKNHIGINQKSETVAMAQHEKEALMLRLMELFVTNVENFEDNACVVGHALHGLKLLLDADAAYEAQAKNAIERDEISVFQLKQSNEMQDKLVNLTLPIVERHAASWHENSHTHVIKSKTSARTPRSSERGTATDMNDILARRDVGAASNTCVEYGLEILFMCELELIVKTARNLNIDIDKMLSNVASENDVDVRIAFQVKKMHQKIITKRMRGDEGFQFSMALVDRPQFGSQHERKFKATTGDVEMRTLVNDLLEDDEEFFKFKDARVEEEEKQQEVHYDYNDGEENEDFYY